MSQEICLKGQSVSKGRFEGTAIVSKTPFGFYGAVDPQTGTVSDRRHELFGQKITDKVLVFPEGRGSTAGAIVILELARCHTSPGAIINRTTEPILATGVILAGKFYDRPLPTIHRLDRDPIDTIKTGDTVRVDADNGEAIVIKRASSR